MVCIDAYRGRSLSIHKEIKALIFVELTMAQYELDLACELEANIIDNELHVIGKNRKGRNYIIPIAGPFFRQDLVVYHKDTNRRLYENRDYVLSGEVREGFPGVSSQLYTTIVFLNYQLVGNTQTTYHTVGGPNVVNLPLIMREALKKLHDLTYVNFNKITGLWEVFPAGPHTHKISNWQGLDSVMDGLDTLTETISSEEWVDVDSVEGLKENFIDPVVEHTKAIADELQTREWKAMPKIYQSYYARSILTNDLGAKSTSDGWFDTTLEVYVDETGNYSPSWDLPVDVVDVGCKVEYRLHLVDGVNGANGPIFFGGQTKHFTQRLGNDCRVKLQAKVTGTTSKFLLNDINSGSQFILIRVA